MPIRWHALYTMDNVEYDLFCVIIMYTFGIVVNCGNNIRNSYIAVSIDNLLTGVSIILTGRVTCDSHGFVCIAVSIDSV